MKNIKNIKNMKKERGYKQIEIFAYYANRNTEKVLSS